LRTGTIIKYFWSKVKLFYVFKQKTFIKTFPYLLQNYIKTLAASRKSSFTTKMIIFSAFFRFLLYFIDQKPFL